MNSLLLLLVALMIGQCKCEDQAVLELRKTVYALHDIKLMMQDLISVEEKVLSQLSRKPARPGGLVEISGREGQTLTLKCRFHLTNVNWETKVAFSHLFEVPQLQRDNLDHGESLGGSGDHSETGEETESSCRPGYNRSLQMFLRDQSPQYIWP